jgi:hypothetical protein
LSLCFVDRSLSAASVNDVTEFNLESILLKKFFKTKSVLNSLTDLIHKFMFNFNLRNTLSKSEGLIVFLKTKPIFIALAPFAFVAFVNVFLPLSYI